MFKDLKVRYELIALKDSQGFFPVCYKVNPLMLVAFIDEIMKAFAIVCAEITYNNQFCPIGREFL